MSVSERRPPGLSLGADGAAALGAPRARLAQRRDERVLLRKQDDGVLLRFGGPFDGVEEQFVRRRSRAWAPHEPSLHAFAGACTAGRQRRDRSGRGASDAGREGPSAGDAAPASPAVTGETRTRGPKSRAAVLPRLSMWAASQRATRSVQDYLYATGFCPPSEVSPI